MLIWGFRTKVALLATLAMACRNGHVAAHRIMKSTRWFTLFFIPLIPYNKRHYSVCIQCGLTLEMSPEDAEALAARASTEQAAQAGIPVDPVTPPLPSTNPSLPPAGWYPDPAGSGHQRYWDGQTWTESVQQL